MANVINIHDLGGLSDWRQYNGASIGVDKINVQQPIDIHKRAIFYEFGKVVTKRLREGQEHHDFIVMGAELCDTPE